MGKEEKKVRPEASRSIADEHYQLGNKGDTEFSQGLAETHKLITDHYFEGTIDQRKEED